jgi:hypothetical protein
MADQRSRQDLLNKLESSLEKLNLIYARLKGGVPTAEEADRSEALV